MSSIKNNEVKVEIIRLRNEGLSIRKLEEKMGIPRATIHDFLNRRTFAEFWEEYDKKPIAGGYMDDHHNEILEFESEKYIITSAQNNTYVHRKFLETLEVAAEELNAKILVGTFSYNTRGFQNLEKGEGEWFDPKIVKYITDKPVKLCNDLMFCGELNILPTAVSPFSGLNSYTKQRSGIVPHAKMQLESLPTHKSRPSRMMYSTGTVTQRNYVAKKAGQKAEFDHVFGALIVEVDKKKGLSWVRQISADKDGSFYDLDKCYTVEGSFEHDGVLGVNYGDIHAEKEDEEIFNLSFGEREDSILNALKPKYQLIHDVLDFEARNHHNIDDPHFMFKMHVENKGKVVDNIKCVANTLNRMKRDFSKVVVVESNHDLALTSWLKKSDFKKDYENAIFYLECQLAKYKSIQNKEKDFHLLEYAIKNLTGLGADDIQFLKTDESFVIGDSINGIECGEHGHNGTNGTRGSINAFVKNGMKYNIGHSHTPCIRSGVYQAGVSGRMDMGYNIGSSSWAQSHIITYPNLKRAILTIKDGKYRGDMKSFSNVGDV